MVFPATRKVCEVAADASVQPNEHNSAAERAVAKRGKLRSACESTVVRGRAVTRRTIWGEISRRCATLPEPIYIYT